MLDRGAYTVLVVDDNPAKRYALVRTAASAGYRTLETANGADAFALAEQADAVLLDVNLRDMHGFEVCRGLRKQDPLLPIIHVSATYVDPAYSIAGTFAGANAYMTAPVDPDELTRQLDELLAQRHGG
jgi:CheY-like chemotaxis protein